MAITTTPRFYVPNFIAVASGGLAVANSNAINASGDRIAAVFPAPKAGTLHSFEWRSGSVANNPDNGVRASFQDISASTGDPDGTQDQYRDFTGTLSANTWQVPGGPMTSDGTDVGSKRTVTAGEMLGCVLDFVSFVASDSFTATTFNLISNLGVRSHYLDDGSTGTYGKSVSAGLSIALKYNDGTYAEFDFPYWPVTAVDTSTYNSTTTPDEKALRFQVPISMRTIGAWLLIDADSAMDVVLYDNASNTLASATLDPDQRALSNAGVHIVYWGSSVTLSANTTYRVSAKPTSATAMILQLLTLPGAGYQACIPGGAEWYYSSRTDAGAWSDTTGTRPMVGLIFDGVDSTAAASGTGAGAWFG